MSPRPRRTSVPLAPAPAPSRPRRAQRLCPDHCPHCGTSLRSAVVGEKALLAARVIAGRRGGAGTTRDVVAAGVCERTTRASELLRQAERAGLVVADGLRPSGHGRGAVLYHVGERERRLIASYGG